MIRNLLCSASLAGLLVSGAALHAQGTAQQEPQPKQHSTEQAKQASGKVTDIASDKKSFTLEVTDGSSKKTMQFQLDGNTQVQGRVSVGTEASVEYQVTPDGKYLALTIAPRAGQAPAPGN
jgi:hypothetical protein